MARGITYDEIVQPFEHDDLREIRRKFDSANMKVS
jgi:hypothetical protein